MNKFIFLFSLFTFSAFLYVYKLDVLPDTFHTDEGETSLQAIRLINDKAGLVGTGWYDLPFLSFAPHALTMAIFGQNIIGARMGSVIFGLLTLPIFYLLVKLLFNQRVAIFATVLLATSHMWIMLSRLGIASVQATFIFVTTLYFVVHGLKTGYKRDFIFAGIFLGLCFYSYYPARLIPFVVVPYIILHSLMEKRLKEGLLQLAIILISALIILIPQIKFYLDYPSTFLSRTQMLYVFSQTGRELSKYEYGNNTDLEIIFSQIGKSLNIFAGDNFSHYGYRGQLLDYATLIFLLLGIFAILKNLSPTTLLISFWFLGSLVGQILTINPPPIFVTRFVVGLPVLYLFTALGIEQIYKLLQQFRNYSYAIIALTLFSITLYNLDIYFIKYPKLQSQDSGARFATLVAGYISSLPNNYQPVLLTDPYLGANFGSLRFLTLNQKQTAMKNPQNYLGSNFNVLGENANSQSSISAYIIHPIYESTLQQIIQIYPNGKLSDLRDKTV